MHRWVLILVAFAAVGLSSARSEDKKGSSQVEGTFVIPKEVASFEGRVAEVRLYKHDPHLADKAADLVEKVEIKDLSHTQGKETKKEFVLGAKATLEPKMGYYITFFILQKDRRTHIGECEHSKKDVCKVLTNGEPSKVSLKVREVK